MSSGNSLILYPYQFAFLCLRDRFTITLKSRQVGFSYAFALRGLYKALKEPGYSALYLSLNQRDAEEKIRYARQIFGSLAEGRKIKLLRDSARELVFSNRSRLLSLPCSSGLRGKSGHLFLDEFAHFKEDEEIFIAALPLASRGYEVHIASTPLGKRGLFYEIYIEKEKYPQFKRLKIPWWYCPVFVNDLATALLQAEEMTTEERVGRFGTQAIKEIFQSFPTLEGFQQEYECSFISNEGAFFPYSVILSAISDDLPSPDTQRGYFYLGVDVGRVRDATAIALVYQPFDKPAYLVNLEILHKLPFREAFQRIENAIKLYRPLKVYIDKTGMGLPLAEELERGWGRVVEGIHFSPQNKAGMMTNLRGLMEKGELIIPRNKELLLQLQGIERQNYSGKGYDDAVWALALACLGIKGTSKSEISGGHSLFRSFST